MEENKIRFTYGRVLRDASDKELDQQIDGEEIRMQRLWLRHCQRVKILTISCHIIYGEQIGRVSEKWQNQAKSYF